MLLLKAKTGSSYIVLINARPPERRTVTSQNIVILKSRLA